MICSAHRTALSSCTWDRGRASLKFNTRYTHGMLCNVMLHPQQDYFEQLYMGPGLYGRALCAFINIQFMHPHACSNAVSYALCYA
jgi:hypothetical protein